MKRALVVGLSLFFCHGRAAAGPGKAELIRDRWGVPHVFAEREADGLFALGYACAEDRLLQMELFRRRATGRLAEVFGPRWVGSDRKFRIAGVPQYCAEAVAALPEDLRGCLRAYAAGVNAFVAAEPKAARKRLSPLGVSFEPWTPADCIAAWMAVGALFDRLFQEAPIGSYREFQRLAAQLGPTEALKRRRLVVDDAVAIVPESEMAKHKAVYARLKAMKPIPGFVRRAAPEQWLRFSHAWTVGGRRSATGKPILESDPQTPVNNPPLWYEFHLSAGRYDVRGIGVAGCPALLIGWNRRVAWGASALGAGCSVTFIEKLSRDGSGYLYRGKTEPFQRRFERIDVKGADPVIQEVLTNRHGFVFNALARRPRAGQAYVSYYKQAQDRGCTVRAMLMWMRARNWAEFRRAMQHYYSPGIHVVYADAAGNIGYQTLVHVPLTRRSPRIALEGWTGRDEVAGRIGLEEMPHMLNPDAGFISHANNLPVGSWYPYDLGLGSGGGGDSSRSWRLRQVLTGRRRFSVEQFESVLHRDTVNPAVVALLPVARKVVEEDKIDDSAVRKVLAATRDWTGRCDTKDPAYPTTKALAGVLVGAYRGSPLRDLAGGGGSGICRLARLLEQRFRKDGTTPKNREVRDYLVRWLRVAGGGGRGWLRRVGGPGAAREVHRMPYQANGPMKFPPLDEKAQLISPPLRCGVTATIWSQRGNSYTQIVDLADVDNSSSLLSPGISEDPKSPFHADQMPLWVKGTTHPAPISRNKVQALASSREVLQTAQYKGPDAPKPKVIDRPGPGRGRLLPAMPKVRPPAGSGPTRPSRTPYWRRDPQNLVADPAQTRPNWSFPGNSTSARPRPRTPAQTRPSEGVR